jgi:hypothetical protein
MNLVLDEHMRTTPCPYRDVMDLRRKRERMSGNAHRPGVATYDEDKAFVDKWHALYGKPPLDDYDVLSQETVRDVEEPDDKLFDDPVWDETFMDVDW